VLYRIQRRSPVTILVAADLSGMPRSTRTVFAVASSLILRLAGADPLFLDFGEKFIFGLVQDSYQFEGSLDADGAGQSNLDLWCQWNLGQPNNGGWELCGDVGAGFYDHMEDDVALLASLGQKHFHFQISWARVIPNGTVVNEAALAFYDRLVDALLGVGITPYVSLEVFDFPKAFQHAWAGWLGRPQIDAYTRFSNVIFARFRGRVRTYFSFHEPNSLCASYPTGGRFVGPRPNANDSSVEDPARDHYTCVYNVLLAHGAAAAALRAADPAATLSMISDGPWLITNTTSAADAAARDRVLAWRYGAYFEPLVTGDWPPEMRAADPDGERIPFFTPAESALLRNSTAYLGLNFYTTLLVAAPAYAPTFPCPPLSNYSGVDAFDYDQCATMFCDASDPRCPPHPNPNPHMSWFHAYPEGLRFLLQWLSARYPRTPLLVTESGVGLDGGSMGNPLSSGDLAIDVNDTAKVQWLTQYYAAAYAALTLDGVDLRGIFLWSFLDNLEWDSGYAAHFGIVHVNHTRPDLQRTPKASAGWFKGVVEQHGFVLAP
jgi:beta-glucosidase/6-phospho-beta-glucosidase/beta-galactosidase